MGCINSNNEIVIPFMYSYVYRGFGVEDRAIVSIQHGRQYKNDEWLYINRANEVLGHFVPQPEGIRLWEKKFHLYTHNGLMGYAYQFGEKWSGAIYKRIEIIDDLTIRVSFDENDFTIINYQTEH